MLMPGVYLLPGLCGAVLQGGSSRLVGVLLGLVFTDGGYSTLGVYIFGRGDLGYSLVWCFCPRV